MNFNFVLKKNIEFEILYKLTKYKIFRTVKCQNVKINSMKYLKIFNIEKKVKNVTMKKAKKTNI